MLTFRKQSRQTQVEDPLTVRPSDVQQSKRVHKSYVVVCNEPMGMSAHIDVVTRVSTEIFGSYISEVQQ